MVEAGRLSLFETACEVLPDHTSRRARFDSFDSNGCRPYVDQPFARAGHCALAVSLYKQTLDLPWRFCWIVAFRCLTMGTCI